MHLSAVAQIYYTLFFSEKCSEALHLVCEWLLCIWKISSFTEIVNAVF
jgi:hypothetical protein